MRLFFSILIFSAFAIRPAIEVSTVLYYQLNIDTIIEKYCVNKERPSLNCNGKCYLMSQLKVNKVAADKNSDTIPIIVEAFIPLFFQENNIIIINNSSISTTYQPNWKPILMVTSGFSAIIDHPPESHLS